MKTISRREFFRECSTATVAALALRSSWSRAGDDGFRLRYSLASSLYGTLPLDVILPEVRKTGADVIDIWPLKHGNQREQIAAMGNEKFAALLKQHDVKLGCLTRYDLGPFKLADEIEFGRRFGAKLIVTGSGGSNKLTGDDLKRELKSFVEKMKPHIEAAANAGIVIGIENHGGCMLATPDSIRWLAEFSPSPSLGIAFAPYHLPQDPVLLAKLIEELGPKLAHFYAWEFGKGCMTKLPKDKELQQLPGRGTLDFRPLLSALRSINYRGWTSVFMHPTPRGVPIMPTAGEVTAKVNESRKYLENCLAPGPALTMVSDNRPAPSNRITLGILGLGSMGLRHVKGFLQEYDCQITAVCDVDASRRAESLDEINRVYGDNGCAQFNDFRELIARPDVDALCISLPDHWHAIPVIMAARAGKAIYGEKPLALTIAEGRAMCDVVKQTGCVWQTGSWQRSTWQFRFGAQLVRNGRIGKLLKVEVGNPIGQSIEPQTVMPVPDGFDYEMWLGPAPWAPYTEKRCHWNFRWILDYSGGQLTDNGAHDIDIAHWGMDCDHTGPLSVEGAGEFPSDGLWDASVKHHLVCKYANGVEMFIGDRTHYPSGVRWIGERGWVYANRDRLETFPKNLVYEKFGAEEIHLYQNPPDRQGHRRNFLDCIKSRAATIAPIEVAHRSISVAHLGNIAMLVGRKIRWNPDTEQILDDPAATRMLSRARREPWIL